MTHVAGASSWGYEQAAQTEGFILWNQTISVPKTNAAF